MEMVRYNPFGGVSKLQDEINRLFNNWGDTDSSGATADWVPNVDILEFDDRFQLYVDIPGVDPKAVEVTLVGGVLNITGERDLPVANEEMVRRRMERGTGRFHRRFILPESVDPEKVKACDRNGVLDISIPKQARAQPRRIKVAA
ncbi:MAG: Hsp20/alpha crystallin family protein [Gammaproteobacteria bacterium]|nr:Hsp20/alpha crystallin family protein [Gammaproteobacteria bacterium]